MPSRYVETIYLAGFFDGEGSVSTDNGVLRLSVGQVNPKPLRTLHRRYGGHLRLIQKSQINPKHQDIYHWTIAARSAVPVLRDLLPYLVVKKAQAVLGLRLQARMLHQGGNRGLPKGEREARDRLVQQLRALNHSRKVA